MRGWWSGHKVIEPSEMEARFSIEDGLGHLDATGTEEISDEGLERLDQVQEVLDLLPDMEADFIECYYIRHMKQTDIAEIFGVSQPTVHYRLDRAAKRIRFLLALPDLAEGELQDVLEGFLSDEMDVKIMMLMFETTCQSEVAKRLGVSQGLVRHRFMRTIAKMGWKQTLKKDKDGNSIKDKNGKLVKEWVQVEDVPGMAKYAALFKNVADNLNILREVQRPSWIKKADYVLA